MNSQKWVCLDVGETLIDETRIWSAWADELRIPRLTLHAAFGAIIARGHAHGDVFSVFGVDDWRERVPSVERAYGGFRREDLYPDAIPTMEALRANGYRLAIVANQPASRTADCGTDVTVSGRSTTATDPSGSTE